MLLPALASKAELHDLADLLIIATADNAIVGMRSGAIVSKLGDHFGGASGVLVDDYSNAAMKPFFSSAFPTARRSKGS